VTSYSALSPVSVALYSALNVAAVTALATGGVGDDMEQRVVATDGSFPTFLLYVVSEKAVGGFGTKPGLKQLPQVDVRLHAFAQYDGAKPAQALLDAALGALFTAFDPTSPTVTISGYATCSLFHDDTSEPFDSLVAGLKVKEVVANLRLFAESTT
jgi:hypothetical protein